MLRNQTLEEKRKRALAIPIRQVLLNEHILPVKEGGVWYKSPYRHENTPSFRIYPKKNIWIDYGLNETKNKGDAINFVMRYKGLNFIEAIDYLLQMDGVVLLPSTPSQYERQDPCFTAQKHCVDEIKPIRNIQLINFLRARGIPLEIANRYCCEIHYTYLLNHKHFYAIGFQNDSNGWVIRTAPYCGKPKGDKYDIIASDITTIRRNPQSVDPVNLVFEGFLNFLSYVVLYGEPEYDVLVLNSSNNAIKLKDIASRGVQKLLFFRDNDDAGQIAYDTLMKYSGCEVNDMSEIYGCLGLNDLNDFLTHKL